ERVRRRSGREPQRKAARRDDLQPLVLLDSAWRDRLTLRRNDVDGYQPLPALALPGRSACMLRPARNLLSPVTALGTASGARFGIAILQRSAPGVKRRLRNRPRAAERPHIQAALPLFVQLRPPKRFLFNRPS